MEVANYYCQKFKKKMVTQLKRLFDPYVPFWMFIKRIERRCPTEHVQPTTAHNVYTLAHTSFDSNAIVKAWFDNKKKNLPAVYIGVV